jgi:hypothetical protein
MNDVQATEDASSPQQRTFSTPKQDISSLCLFHPTRSGSSRIKSMRSRAGSIASVAYPDPRSVINSLVPGSYFGELINNFLGLKCLNSLSVQWCGSGIRCLFLALDSGWKNPDPGSTFWILNTSTHIQVDWTAVPVSVPGVHPLRAAGVLAL